MDISRPYRGPALQEGSRCEAPIVRGATPETFLRFAPPPAPRAEISQFVGAVQR